VIDPAGGIVARYDKIHLFDVDLANGETYRESATVQGGGRAVLAPTPWGLLGLTICYDLRFGYLHRALAQAGASFLSIPAAFTHTTGKAHWHVLQRARAIETGCWVFAANQGGIHAEGKRTYGHSLIVNPWGEVVADGGAQPGYIIAEVDPAKVAEARSMVPACAMPVQGRPRTTACCRGGIAGDANRVSTSAGADAIGLKSNCGWRSIL
jgi:predicted amidohydrolase